MQKKENNFMTKKTSPLRKKTSTKSKKTKRDPQSSDVLSTEIVADITQEDIFGVIEADDKKTQLQPIDISAEQPVKKLKPKEKVHYVNGREFEEEIRNYYNTGNITIKLGESLNKIANGLSYAPNFLNYSYKEDMVGDAIVKMFAALKHKKFRLDSGFSPFSYFTTIAFHAFINRIKKEKKHHEVINEYKEKIYSELMHEASDSCAGNIYVEPTGDDEYEE
jgi:hypothetical protein